MSLLVVFALSSSSSSASSKFDLNCNDESVIPIYHLKKRKQDDDDDDGDLHVLQTLPLLVWNNLCDKTQLNQQLHDDADDDDDDGEVQSNSVFVHRRYWI